MHINLRLSRRAHYQNTSNKALLGPVGCPIVVMIWRVGNGIDGLHLVRGVIVFAIARDGKFMYQTLHLGYIEMTIRAKIQRRWPKEITQAFQFTLTEIDWYGRRFIDASLK